jgi:hypothetical protein
VIYTENKIVTTYGDLKGFRVAKFKGVLGFRVAKCKWFRGCKIGYCTLILDYLTFFL